MNRKKTRIILVIIVCFVFGIPSVFTRGATEVQTASSIERRAVDALGREVVLTKEPQRIAVVGRAAIMPADALFLFPQAMHLDVILSITNQGLGDFFSLIKPEFAQQQRLGQTVGIEEILRTNPDLILTKSNNYDAIVPQLEPFGIPVFVMDLESTQAWKDEIMQLGELLGDRETPKRVISQFERRERFVQERIALLTDEQKPSVLMMQVADSDGTSAFSVAPEQWIQTMIVEQAGGKPVWVDTNVLQRGWSKVSFEQIASWDPSHIFLISYRRSVQPFIQEIRSKREWSELSAYTQGRIKGTPADVMNYVQPDSRWILALQWLASELHPSLFPDFSMEQEIIDFYRDFYHITDDAILRSLVDLYRKSLGNE